MEFIKGRREVEYYLVEEEVTRTAEKRGDALEAARWGLAGK